MRFLVLGVRGPVRSGVEQRPLLAREWNFEGLRTLDNVRNRKNGIKFSNHQEVCGCSHSVWLGYVILTRASTLKLGLKYYDGRSP